MERMASEEEVPLAPINILTVLDKNQIGELAQNSHFLKLSPSSGGEHSSERPEEELQ